MIAYWYVFLILAAGVFLWRKDLRREMVWAGLITLPVIALIPLLSGKLDALTFSSTTDLVERGLIAFSFGAIASVLYEILFGKILSPQHHPARRRLSWLFSGLVVFAIVAFGFHVSYLTALLIALTVDIAVVFIIRHDLIWDAIVSGAGLALLYAAVFYTILPASSLSITSPLSLTATSGVYVFSLPLEELLAVFLFGALWGPLYAAVKHFEEKTPAEFYRLSLHPKMVLTVFILVGVLGGLAWFTDEFILVPSVAAVSPSPNSGTIGLSEKIIFTFDRPVDRNRMVMTWTPE